MSVVLAREHGGVNTPCVRTMHATEVDGGGSALPPEDHGWETG